MLETSTIGQRFTQLIQQLGITKNAFAQSIGRTATVVQHLVDERNYPGYELLCRVVQTYPNVSLNWLMLGEGPMLLASNTAELPQAEPVEVAGSVADAIDFGPLAAPVRRRNGTHLQPADIAATLTLAGKAAKPVASSPTAFPPVAELVAQNPLPVPPPQTGKLSPPALAPTPAATVAPSPPEINYVTASLQAQYVQHQLALAEQRNQHLQEQVTLLQQMIAILQKNA